MEGEVERRSVEAGEGDLELAQAHGAAVAFLEHGGKGALEGFFDGEGVVERPLEVHAAFDGTMAGEGYEGLREVAGELIHALQQSWPEAADELLAGQGEELLKRGNAEAGKKVKGLGVEAEGGGGEISDF
jgi:hypothetical protein